MKADRLQWMKTALLPRDILAARFLAEKNLGVRVCRREKKFQIGALEDVHCGGLKSRSMYDLCEPEPKQRPICDCGVLGERAKIDRNTVVGALKIDQRENS